MEKSNIPINAVYFNFYLTVYDITMKTLQNPVEMVRDIFLCGVSDHNLRRDFYKEGGEITVQKMLEIVLTSYQSEDTLTADQDKIANLQDEIVNLDAVSLGFTLVLSGSVSVAIVIPLRPTI